MKIPENQNPYRVIVNGVETIYTPGAEATVPDAVAEMIEADKNYPAPAPAPEPIIPIEKELPARSAADSGKVLKVGEDGTPEWGSGGGSADATFVVTIEPVHGGLENPSATFAEIVAASESGKAVFLVSPKTSTAGGAQYVLTAVSSSGATFERLFYNATNQTISANIVICSDADAWSIMTKTLSTS